MSNLNGAIGERIAISDTGHHRILISDMTGNVSQIVGGPTQGFVDGEFQSVRFSSPQGVCWNGSNTLFVADCNNHAVRKVSNLCWKICHTKNWTVYFKFQD